ncbi:unnamed protein product [Caenorhabditis nigoni]
MFGKKFPFVSCNTTHDKKDLEKKKPVVDEILEEIDGFLIGGRRFGKREKEMGYGRNYTENTIINENEAEITITTF